jgi:hypothetical protein
MVNHTLRICSIAQDRTRAGSGCSLYSRLVSGRLGRSCRRAASCHPRFREWKETPEGRNNRGYLSGICQLWDCFHSRIVGPHRCFRQKRRSPAAQIASKCQIATDEVPTTSRAGIAESSATRRGATRNVGPTVFGSRDAPQRVANATATDSFSGRNAAGGEVGAMLSRGPTFSIKHPCLLQRAEYAPLIWKGLVEVDARKSEPAPPTGISIFLARYSEARAPQPPSVGLLAFLDRWHAMGAAHARSREGTYGHPPHSTAAFLKLLPTALADARRAGAFIDVWAVAGLARKEVRTTAVLGWLLDPRGGFCNCPVSSNNSSAGPKNSNFTRSAEMPARNSPVTSEARKGFGPQR